MLETVETLEIGLSQKMSGLMPSAAKDLREKETKRSSSDGAILETGSSSPERKRPKLSRTTSAETLLVHSKPTQRFSATSEIQKNNESTTTLLDLSTELLVLIFKHLDLDSIASKKGANINASGTPRFFSSAVNFSSTCQRLHEIYSAHVRHYEISFFLRSRNILSPTDDTRYYLVKTFLDFFSKTSFIKESKAQTWLFIQLVFNAHHNLIYKVIEDKHRLKAFERIESLATQENFRPQVNIVKSAAPLQLARDFKVASKNFKKPSFKSLFLLEEGLTSTGRSPALSIFYYLKAIFLAEKNAEYGKAISIWFELGRSFCDEKANVAPGYPPSYLLAHTCINRAEKLLEHLDVKTPLESELRYYRAALEAKPWKKKTREPKPAPPTCSLL